MFYIRFLKAPHHEIDSDRSSFKALVTITTDLGDRFYHEDVTLYAALFSQIGNPDPSWKTFQWKAGMRVLWLNMSGADPKAMCDSLTLFVSPRQRFDSDRLQDDMAHILSARILLPRPHDSSYVFRTIRRDLSTTSGQLRIHEGMGESIVRHIWDASIGLMMYLDTMMHLTLDIDPKAGSAWKLLFRQEAAISVLELGTGTGIAGLFLASIKAHCSCLLTDVGEAMDLLNLNVSTAALKQGSTVTTKVLDWEMPVPSDVERENFDLIVISDCTYNPDTVKALVGTLTGLMQLSPHAVALVAMKVRHESEMVFFEIMSEAGLVQLEECPVPLSKCSADGGAEALERVDVYAYGLGSGSCILGPADESERTLAVSGS